MARDGSSGEVRDGVELKHLDQELFEQAGVTKGDLIDYLDAVADRMLPELRDRPLTVLRVRPGTQPFMQKNLPAYAPDWIPTVAVWAQASQREVRYPLCHDRRTLIWFGGQRAVEFHPTVVDLSGVVRHVIIDLDPPLGAPFSDVVAAVKLVRAAMSDAGLAGAVKTSGAKGLHVVIPIESAAGEDTAAATRALAARAERMGPELVTTAFLVADRGDKIYLDPTRSGGASLACAYSPRARPGLPVSFPIAWSDLDAVVPADFTVRTAPALLGNDNPWRDSLPAPQSLPADLVAEGHGIPVPRVVAMHEGKRRARARRMR